MTERSRWMLLVLVAAAVAAGARAQDPYTPYAPLPLGGRLLNLPTATTMPRKTWEIRFTHRFSQAINDGDEHSLWGLDSSADIGIGVAWTPVRSLETEIFRSDIQDNWEASLKYAILRQADAVPVSITARAGADISTERDLEGDRVSSFAQVILSRKFGRRLELFAIPTYANEAGPFDHAFNLPVGAAWQFRPYLSLVAELVPENRDLADDFETDLAWAVGLKRAIGGHYFEVVLTNSRATHVNQYMAGDFLGGIDAGDVHLGFNIERRFGGGS